MPDLPSLASYPPSPPRTLRIFDLGDARFGVDAKLVRESVRLPELTPFEETPPHIIGTFSLRGNLFTRLDLRAALKLPRATQGSGKAVIAHADWQAAGVVADEVHDVIYLREEALQAAPAALREQHEEGSSTKRSWRLATPDYETRHARSLSSILSRKRARKQTNRCASFTLTV